MSSSSTKNKKKKTTVTATIVVSGAGDGDSVPSSSRPAGIVSMATAATTSKNKKGSRDSQSDCQPVSGVQRQDMTRGQLRQREQLLQQQVDITYEEGIEQLTTDEAVEIDQSVQTVAHVHEQLRPKIWLPDDQPTQVVTSLSEQHKRTTLSSYDRRKIQEATNRTTRENSDSGFDFRAQMKYGFIE